MPWPRHSVTWATISASWVISSRILWPVLFLSFGGPKPWSEGETSILKPALPSWFEAYSVLLARPGSFRPVTRLGILSSSLFTKWQFVIFDKNSIFKASSKDKFKKTRKTSRLITEIVEFFFKKNFRGSATTGKFSLNQILFSKNIHRKDVYFDASDENRFNRILKVGATREWEHIREACTPPSPYRPRRRTDAVYPVYRFDRGRRCKSGLHNW